MGRNTVAELAVRGAPECATCDGIRLVGGTEPLKAREIPARGSRGWGPVWGMSFPPPGAYGDLLGELEDAPRSYFEVRRACQVTGAIIGNGIDSVINVTYYNKQEGVASQDASRNGHQSRGDDYRSASNASQGGGVESGKEKDVAMDTTPTFACPLTRDCRERGGELTCRDIGAAKCRTRRTWCHTMRMTVFL